MSNPTDQPQPAAELSANLESLPSPPFVAMEVIRLTGDPASDAGDLAAVLGHDPVLATRILQLANSPAYGLSHQVTSVERATALLGLKAVKMMALSFSLAGDVGDSAGALSVERYWYHSLLNAVTARRWAEITAPGLTEEAFLAGLVSHLGRLVLAREMPEKFAVVLETALSDWPTHDDERSVFGFCSAEVTNQLLRAWGLPAIIVEAAASMYSSATPDRGVNGAAELAAVMGRCVVTEAALTHDPGTDELVALRAVAAEVGMSEDQVDEFVVDLEGRVRTMARMLDVRIPTGTSHRDLLDQARSKLVAVSLEAAQNLRSAEQQAEALRVSNAALEDMAFVDRLTGVPNRAAFDDHLARSIAGVVRKGSGTVGMLLLDIDHFKAFNDTYGHQLGDQVLRQAAQAMASVVRSDELFARFGGEEFALVAVDCTGADLFITGERLRKAVEAVRIPSEAGPLTVTVSGGASVLDDVFDRGAGERVLKLADEALYEAKENGRNQIRVAR